MGTFCDAFGIIKIEAPFAVANEFRRKLPKQTLGGLPDHLNLSKGNKFLNQLPKRSCLLKRRKQLCITSVARLVTKPSSARRNKKLMSYFLENSNSRKASCSSYKRWF